MFEEFSGWFNGKTSPVHLFWHSLDLAVTRFSGRPGAPMDADPVTQEAYSQEVISFGFWAGDDNVGDAAYYAYTAPEPQGLRDQPLSAGEWIDVRRRLVAILPYETVRTAREPKQGCSRSSRAPTRPVRASRAGIPRASSRHGAPARRNCASSTPTRPLPSGERARRCDEPITPPGRGGARCTFGVVEMATRFPAGGRAAELVGRRSECEALNGLIEAVRAGQSRALVVRGEPGVGKTALLEYVVERASDWNVARAAGVQAEMELAFAGLHQLLAPALDRVERLPVPQRDALRTALGLAPGSAPDRFLVSLAVLSLFSDVAEER